MPATVLKVVLDYVYVVYMAIDSAQKADARTVMESRP